MKISIPRDCMEEIRVCKLMNFQLQLSKDKQNQQIKPKLHSLKKISTVHIHIYIYYFLEECQKGKLRFLLCKM